MAHSMAYIGCFTTKERKARGKGISVYRIDHATGAWTLAQIQEAPVNPQFLSFDREQKFLYAAHGSSGEISAYAIDGQSGALTALNRQPTQGNNGAHVSVDPSNRYVLLANGPGIAVFPINADGSLAPYSDLVLPPGVPGPRTEHAHPHQVLFDPSGRYLLVCDHGIDKILIYRLDAAAGKLVAHGEIKTAFETAPRHLAFHPALPLAYVINEHASTIGAYHWDAGRGALQPFQMVRTTPDAFGDKNTVAEIAVAPSGKFVYVTNRGHNSIATFSADAGTGTLSAIGWEPTQGKTPRFFTLDAGGEFLYVANQDSDSIVIFKVDRDTGKLQPTGNVVQTGSPSCILFARR